MKRRGFLKNLFKGVLGLAVTRQAMASQTAINSSYCGLSLLPSSSAGIGKLCNCFIMPRMDQSGPMFEARSDGTIVANLDGYAIVPRYMFEENGSKK
jgi:hypothetical protein